MLLSISIQNRVSTERKVEIRITQCQNKLAKFIKLEASITLCKTLSRNLEVALSLKPNVLLNSI